MAGRYFDAVRGIETVQRLEADPEAEVFELSDEELLAAFEADIRRGFGTLIPLTCRLRAELWVRLETGRPGRVKHD
jgi:hypothetical protein